MRVEYAKSTGITLFCRDYRLVPTSYRHAAAVIKEVDAYGNILRVFDKKGADERKDTGQSST